jgi:flagellar hook assembly protein FlgD
MNFIGLITGVSFYNDFVTNLPQMPTKVWLGTTTQTDLSAGYIPSTGMTLVFDGLVDYPSGQNTVTIGFPEAFLYLQDNLVMMVQRPMDTGYYSTSDRFQHQTIGTNRARRVASDATTYDPTNPPAGTLTGQFPKTSFLVIPGGVGHLNGTVLGAGNIPLENATVQVVGGGQTTTNALGEYSIINIIAETYDVTCSRHGYISQTVNVVIPEDSTVVQNFTLQQLPTVDVTGTIVGSDAPTVGLPGASINLTGYEDYSATANAQGQFTITGVYTNQTYTYFASGLGYQESIGTINVGTVDLNMGNLVLNEIAYTPRSVTADQNTPPTSVTVAWQAPDPNAVDITAGFENLPFPPAEWTQEITNNGPANTLGVLPTWCRFGTIVNGTTTIAPQEGAWQAGFWWDYNHQDEWLITPQFNCPQGATLSFWTYAYYGSLNNDHYYVKISSNNGTTWTTLWDATALTGGYNTYQNAVNVDLSPFAGQQVKIAWHADDPNSSSDGMWYNWFIDNVVIGSSTTTIRFAEGDMTSRSGSAERSVPLIMAGLLPMSRSNDKVLPADDYKSHLALDTQHPHQNTRSIEGYKVWRLVQGQELNETTWVLLTPDMITDLTITDNGWASVDAGTYKWAVKAIYTNDVLSLGAFSNPVVKVPVPTGTLVGVVRNANNVAIMGATITAGNYTTTSLTNGSYNMAVAAGTYSVTCTATGYEDLTNNNVIITAGQTTISNFTMITGIDEEVQIARTELKGNYPNPFNPETLISFDIKVKTPVRIEIYNTKGQLVRTLVNDWTDKGHHQVVWNGKDDYGHSVASGVYQYRMQAGEYIANRRMMLLK